MYPLIAREEGRRVALGLTGLTGFLTLFLATFFTTFFFATFFFGFFAFLAAGFFAFLAAGFFLVAVFVVFVFVAVA